MKLELAVLVLLAILGLLTALPGAAGAFEVSGRFLYEDRLFDGSGYTGAVQNLPIRHARVEVVNAVTQLALASGVTGADGRYTIAVTGQVVAVSLFVRCVTDGRPAGYAVRVVDNFVRVPGEGLALLGPLYSIATANVLAHDPSQDLAMGDYLIQDPDGSGVAQAFNILDNGVDFFDWVASLEGSLPAPEDSLVYAWKATGTPGNPPPAFGSNYSQQGIYIGADPTSDTDGWSDTVILHETGHWYDDMYSRSDNPGGAHYLGDNDANVLLAYGEGAATFHCAKVREFRASRLNLSGEPVDRLVSLYADLTIPPPVGTPGALSFSYDFETGNFGDTGLPLGQRGSANETNVTSALWDLMDAPSTPDATPGVDDDPVEAADAVAWQIEHVYLRGTPASNALTVEDYQQGWFAVNGPGYQQSGIDAVFVTLARMPFAPDAFELDGNGSGAHLVVPVTQHVSPGGHVVINEIDMGPYDAVEFLNDSPQSIDLTGWQMEVYANGITNDPTRIYTFPPFTLEGGEVVAVHEGGTPDQNTRHHLHAGDQQVFNASWNPGLDGACVLRDVSGTAVDFVRWRDANGIENTTPVPAGTAFSGSLASPVAPDNLTRDVNGADHDQATDFTARPGSLGSANHPAPEAHTIFGAGDQDLVTFQAEAGRSYGFEARGPFSASDPMIELIGPDGAVVGSNDDAEAGIRDARLDFYASAAGVYSVRVRHVGANTDWAEYDLLAFERPAGVTLVAPSSVAARADHASDTADAVTVRWLNAMAYDSVHVYRDSTLIARLAGAPGEYVDHADRGVYRYEVAGIAGGTESARVSVHEYAGRVSCHAEDDFESGSGALWVTDGSRWDVTPANAASGTFSFTDSPAGNYVSCNDVLNGCSLDYIATFAVPAILPPGSTLDFDQICITEATYDFGIVEISKDEGRSWTELARYDQTAYPEWMDDVAGPTDWKHATLDLSAFAHQAVTVRFRLYCDTNLDKDGWYVDNVKINPADCSEVTGVGGDPAPRFALRPPVPNPVREGARMAFTLPRSESRVELAIFDVQGRARRTVKLGALPAGNHAWTWDGRDSEGRPLASGAYFARLVAGSNVEVQKLLKLAP